jgi:hypothetical protein
MGIIEDQKIRFVNLLSGHTVYKAVNCTFDNDHCIAISHISQFVDLETINEMIDKVTLAINGLEDQSNDSSFSTELQIAFITPDGLKFYDEPVLNVIAIYPLDELREMLLAWRDFLQTEPLHGTWARKNRRNSNL